MICIQKYILAKSLFGRMSTTNTMTNTTVGPVYQVIGTNFKDDLTRERKCLSLVVKFRDQKQLDLLEGNQFDYITEDLSVAVRNKYGGSWYLDDVVEIDRDASEDEKVDLDLSAK